MAPDTENKAPSTVMEAKTELLEGLQQQKPTRPGDVISGMVVSLELRGALVDVGGKSEGLVPPSEMQTLGSDHLKALKPGDKVMVLVLRGEDEKGEILLSLDRARRQRGWYLLEQSLANGEIVEVEAVAENKGGLLVNYEGIQGFVPRSQLVSQGIEVGSTGESPARSLGGSKLKVKVLELNRQRNRLIFSERAAHREWREQQKEKLLEEIQEGELRRGKVSSLHNFGAFIDLGGLDGLLPASEVSWERGQTPSQVLKTGEELEVKVIKVDKEAKRVVVSRRRLHPQPWENVSEKYKVGQIVSGTVTGVVNFGAFVSLDGGIEGLVHISELADRRLNHAKEVVNKGDALTLKVLSIDPQKRHLRLSLRQAQGEEESMPVYGAVLPEKRENG